MGQALTQADTNAQRCHVQQRRNCACSLLSSFVATYVGAFVGTAFGAGFGLLLGMAVYGIEGAIVCAIIEGPVVPRVVGAFAVGLIAASARLLAPPIAGVIAGPIAGLAFGAAELGLRARHQESRWVKAK